MVQPEGVDVTTLPDPQPMRRRGVQARRSRCWSKVSQWIPALPGRGSGTNVLL